jgi:MoaA/NifB/PqqE/SkfB family radical SAM enzyme
MFDNITGFHIEPTNICTLKCSGCARTRFINQWPQHWKNHNLDIDALLKFLDVDLVGKKIYLCGNYGDSIYHTDFINFISKLKKTGVYITIVTNGSHRTQEWWQQLVNCLDDNDTIQFSIDGIPENFTQYRINADWPSIEAAIKICSAGACNTVWKYIPFAFNQYNIEQAKALANDLGIDSFLLTPSDRFDTQTWHLLPKNTELIHARFSVTEAIKKQNIIPKVDPKCNSGQTHFITAAGHYSSCCFATDHRFYYKTPFGKNKNQFDITKITLSQLLSRDDVLDFYQNLDQHSVCQYNCPKIGG